MATYKQIQEHIKEKHKCSVKSCWIADMKEKSGLPTRRSWNRISETKRKHPCPTKHQKKIEDAFRFFNMV